MGSLGGAIPMKAGAKRKRHPDAYSNHEDSAKSDTDSSENESTSELDVEDCSNPYSQITTPSSAPSSPSTSQHPSDLRKRFQCTFDGCSKAFNRPAKLQQHLRSHTNTRPFVCPQELCRKPFLRESHLKQHTISAHTDVRDYPCTWPNCDKKFVTATRLRRHIEAHEGREKFRCGLLDCGLTFRKQSTLDVHIAKVHDKIKPFPCSFLDDYGKSCLSRFDTASKLRDHEGRIHRTKRYTCSICSTTALGESGETLDGQAAVTFSTYSALREHTASQHPPTCTECGLRCVTQTTLKAHMEICHSGLSLGERKQFKCTEPNCDAAFTKQGNLRLHIKTIHAERRFVCDVGAARLSKGLEAWDGHNSCGMALPAKSQMVEHIRTRHLGLSPGPLPRTKRARKVARSGTVIDGLVGFDDTTARRADIACPVYECDRTFLRGYDMDQHLVATHHLSNHDVESLPHDGTSSIEKFHVRPSLSGGSVIVTAADLEAERLFDGVGDGLQGNTEGGDDHFWIGGLESFGQSDQDHPAWLDEEEEMRRLIDEELAS